MNGMVSITDVPYVHCEVRTELYIMWINASPLYVTRFRRLFIVLSPWRSRFKLGPVYLVFAEIRFAQEHGFLRALPFPPARIIPPFSSSESRLLAKERKGSDFLEILTLVVHFQNQRVSERKILPLVQHLKC
jgi:hypothetical protein